MQNRNEILNLIKLIFYIIINLYILIQLIFFDDTKILIDEITHKSVIFLDLHKHYIYDLHLVNKCSNRKFNKRYDYYKKFFFESIEKFLASKQKNKQNAKKNKFKPLGLDDDSQDEEGFNDEKETIERNEEKTQRTNREKNKLNFSF